MDSEQMVAAGHLYVVATPIGNRMDITLRALKVLEQVDVVAAEDTRHTRKLFSMYGIHNRLTACHEHNEAEITPKLIQRLKDGESIALVSDAGTPMVSDPGYRLVLAAVRNAIPVIPVPGASAAIAALSASGLPTDMFTVAGFLPKSGTRRLDQLTQLARVPGTLVIYESPKRVRQLLADLQAHFGDREAVLSREITKYHEEFVRGRLSDIERTLEQRPNLKGECTLVVSGPAKTPPVSGEDLDRMMRDAVEDPAAKPAEIARRIAKEHGLSKNEIYQRILEMKNRTRE